MHFVAWFCEHFGIQILFSHRWSWAWPRECRTGETKDVLGHLLRSRFNGSSRLYPVSSAFETRVTCAYLLIHRIPAAPKLISCLIVFNRLSSRYNGIHLETFYHEWLDQSFRSTTHESLHSDYITAGNDRNRLDKNKAFLKTFGGHVPSKTKIYRYSCQYLLKKEIIKLMDH